MKTLHKLRRAICLWMALFLLLPCLSVQAEENQAPLLPTLTADGEKALIYNLEHDRLLWSEGANDPIAPASFVKIMTAVLGFEHMQSRGDYEVTVSEYTVKKTTGTKLGLKTGEILPFSQLLYGAVVGSANDAALAIAEAVSGSEAEFIALMNRKAKDLGMNETYFANPTGMDQSAMITTLADMIKLCAYAYRINDYMIMTSVVDHTIPATNLSKARKLHTKNLLIDPNPYTGYYTKDAVGMSAGSTTKAGFCLATATANNGLTFLILIANGKYQNDVYSSFTDGGTLVKHARSRYRVTEIIPQNKAISEIKVELGKGTDNAMLITESKVELLLPVDYVRDWMHFRYLYSYDTLTAPVEKGKAVGRLEVYYEGKLLGSTALVTQREIPISHTDAFIRDLITFFQHPTVILVIRITLLVLSLALLVFLFFYFTYQRKQSAEDRKAIKEYLKENEEEYKEYKKHFWKEFHHVFRVRRANKERRRRQKEQTKRLKEQQRQAVYRQILEKESRRNRTGGASSAQNTQRPPQKTPPAPPPSRRGDEYYRK